LQEWTRERVPLDWALTQNNLGTALRNLGERASGTARLEQAVAACHDALQERTRERVPLDWAITQNNLGNALLRLGERESGTARLEQAVAAFREALAVFELAGADRYIAMARENLARVETLLAGRRANGTT
jgi:tetratricopeptide (TPR) repeat protein